MNFALSIPQDSWVPLWKSGTAQKYFRSAFAWETSGTSSRTLAQHDLHPALTKRTLIVIDDGPKVQL
jgi:hypothetical protein